MNDSGAIVVTTLVGGGVGGFAALLYVLTSGSEPAGFRVIPSTAGAWVGYGFRMLILATLVSMFLSTMRGIPPAVSAFRIGLACLLIGTSSIPRDIHRNLSGFGFVLGAVALLLPVLFPSIHAER